MFFFNKNNEREHKYYISLDLYQYYSGELLINNNQYFITLVLNYVFPFHYKFAITKNRQKSTELQKNNKLISLGQKTKIEDCVLQPISLSINKDSLYMNIEEFKKNLGYYEGFYIPEIIKKDLNDNTINFKKLSKNYLLIDFWGSWCGYCIKKTPLLVSLSNKFKDLEIISVALEYSESAVKKTIENMDKYNMKWKHIIERSDKKCLPKQFDVNAFPTLILINPEGKIVLREVGGDIDNISKILRLAESNDK